MAKWKSFGGRIAHAVSDKTENPTRTICGVTIFPLPMPQDAPDNLRKCKNCIRWTRFS